MEENTFDVGTGIATVRVTTKGNGIVRATTPYVIDPTSLQPFYVEFNPAVPVENVNAVAELVRGVAGI